jgi:class 3 adenylate cyclase
MHSYRMNCIFVIEQTVNNASKMESTGESGKIQISETTAALINKAGKG